MSGPRETFIKRQIVERTNKAEKRPEEESEKAESCRENLWNEIQLKGLYRQKQTQEQNKACKGQMHRQKKLSTTSMEITRRDVPVVPTLELLQRQRWGKLLKDRVKRV